jgi:hypothetical protein
MKYSTSQTIGNRVLIVMVLTTMPGALLFMGSIHGGGPSLWVAAALVPPLFLDIYGLLKIDELWLWLFVVLTLQMILVTVLVCGLSWLHQAVVAKPMSESK